MNNKIIIGVDNGNKQTKTETEIFTSGIAKYDTEPVMTKDWLKYQNEYYVLSPKRNVYLKDKTQNEDTFILTLFAIAKEIENRDIYKPFLEIVLAVGLPPEHMKLKKNYIDYFSKKGNIVFSYNGKLFTIHISEIFVFPQAFSAIATTDLDIFSCAQTCYLLDWGGYTLDVIEISESKINPATIQSYEQGIIVFYNNVIKEMRQRNIRIKENEIDSIILMNDDDIFISNDDKQHIRDMAQSFVNGVLSRLEEDGYYISQYKTVLIGGACVSLKGYINSSGKVPHAEFVDDIHANARGYQILAEGKLGD